MSMNKEVARRWVQVYGNGGDRHEWIHGQVGLDRTHHEEENSDEKKTGSGG